MAREDEIRLIAYSIWEEEGCPNGRDCEHWYRAEIIWQDRQAPSAVPVATKPAARRTTTKAPAAKPGARGTARKETAGTSSARRTKKKPAA